MGYLDGKNRWLYYLGIAMNICGGLLQPFYAVILGIMVRVYREGATQEEQREMLYGYWYFFLIISLLLFLTGWLGFSLTQVIAERLVF